MTAWKRGIMLCGALSAAVCASAALAAPERLGDQIPDAFPDQPHAFSFGYSHESIQLDGPLNDDRAAHNYFKLRYTLNPRTALAFRYGNHDLTGGQGLTTPLFDNRDGAESYTFDLSLNLLNVPATPADPDNGVEYAAGSAFGIGVSGTLFQMDMGDLANDDSLLRAYLVYTSDLSPELRAHTMFTTSRLTGDNQSGSVNRVAAGLDYTLIDGPRPLVLLANGILDVYNFREPEFNTSRVSRFDVGLRYRVAEDWYASLGYVTVNDSENDASGSGIYAGVQFVDEPRPAEPECEVIEEEPLPEAPPVAEPAPVEQQSAAQPEPVTETVEQPPLMVVPVPNQSKQPPGTVQPTEEVPAEQADATVEQPTPAAAAEAAAGDAQPPDAEEAAAVEDTADEEQQPEATAEAGGDGTNEPADGTAEAADDAAEQPPAEGTAEAADNAAEQPAADGPPETTETDEIGVAIPPFPQQRPRHTPAGAIMARAGLIVGAPRPHHTRPGDLMQRPPTDPAEVERADLIAGALELPAAEQPAVLALDSELAVAAVPAAEPVDSDGEATTVEAEAGSGPKLAAAAGG